MEPQVLPDLLQLRYGERKPATPPAWHALLTVLLSHRSVRAYAPEPLPPGTLTALVAAAQSAASSSNLQAWSVVSVEDQARKARLAQLAGDQAHVRECPLFLVWLADLARLARVAEQRNLPYAALDYTEMLLLAAIDATLAAQNAVVAAEALGLGTVYIGGIRNHPLDVAAELRLPPRVFPLFGLCVGWPDDARTAAIKPRLPQNAVLHHETYALEQQDTAVADYNRVMAAFYTEQRMNVDGDWAEHSARRVAGPQSLSGRHTLREALQALGFDLR
ncbi:MAG TPA: NADPH-dependent oxidoreductase [Kouleothrix sp.]|uniref:NADPH-dependent oxidoreductase n=1 Tax=Kouleothrix sp. TaxID=2779161 RepID=UPI002C09B8BD|nr:NADPH-dependent oxidoreductase [Kouleothrix sp.]